MLVGDEDWRPLLPNFLFVEIAPRGSIFIEGGLCLASSRTAGKEIEGMCKRVENHSYSEIMCLQLSSHPPNL